MSEAGTTRLSLRIDWSELDLFGHVNNVMFVKYMQAARLHYAEHIGLMTLHRDSGIGFMVAENRCQFRKPLHFPGTVHISTKAVAIKNTSFVLEHTLLNDKGEVAALGSDVLVVYDFNRNEKCLIPQEIRQSMQSM